MSFCQTFPRRKYSPETHTFCELKYNHEKKRSLVKLVFMYYSLITGICLGPEMDQLVNLNGQARLIAE